MGRRPSPMTEPRYTQAEIACLVAKAELDYLSRPGHAVRQTVVRGDLVVILGSSRTPLARYRARVSRCRVGVERIL